MNNNERIKKILILISSLINDIVNMDQENIMKYTNVIFEYRTAISSLMFSKGDLEEVFKDSIPLDELGKFESEAKILFYAKNYIYQNTLKLKDRFNAIKTTIKEYCKYKNLKIFYSWQSDLPNNTNRSFIQKAIQSAINKINEEKGIKMYLDYDTRRESGSPDIVYTILRKIDESQVLICDVTSIGKLKSKQMPNPNVLFELGYAIKCLGESNIIMIYNTAFGKIKDLPFDLNQKRIMTYNCKKCIKNKASIRKELTGKIKEAIELILESY